MQSLNRLKSTRPRRKNDFYETPIELCVAALQQLKKDHAPFYDPIDILDPGAGRGVWGRAAREVFPHSFYLRGIDIEKVEKPLEYNDWVVGDYLSVVNDCGFDLISGNPPYSLAEEFVRKSFDFLVAGGKIFFLFRLAFLESQKRCLGLWKEFPPKQVYVLGRRPSFFSSNGRTRTVDATAYAMFLWQKGWEGDTKLDWLHWNYEK